jgi:hypothetical protein
MMDVHMEKALSGTMVVLMVGLARDMRISAMKMAC